MSGFLNLGLGFAVNQPVAAAGGGGSSYHPDDDGAGADLYILANADDITEVGTGVDRWEWRNNAGAAAGHNFKQVTDSSRPSYNASGTLGKPCVTFNGTSDKMLGRNNANSADLPMSTFLATNGLGCILAVVRPAGITSGDSFNHYNNDCIIGDDSGGSGGLCLRTGFAVAWGYDGAQPASEAAITVPNNFVLTWRKDATKIYVSVNGSEEAGTTCGNISTLSYGIEIGDSVGQEFNGELYCIMAWKSTPATLADIITNLKAYFGIS